MVRSQMYCMKSSRNSSVSEQSDQSGCGQSVDWQKPASDTSTCGLFVVPRIEPGAHSCKGPWHAMNMKGRWKGGQIERGRKHGTVHTSLADAFAEANQLSQLHPKMNYGVFECIGYIKSRP